MENLKLDAIDVLFMHYITDRTTDEADKYDFWQLQYGRRPADLLRRLMEAGVIYEDDSLPAVLQKLRVYELKHILRSARLKVSGNKQALIKRILQHATEIDFAPVPLKNVYKLSERHSEFHSRTRFLNYFHFHGNFDLHEIYGFHLAHDSWGAHRTAVAFLEGKARAHMHAANKYTAVKSYFLLSNYALNEMQDKHLSMHYLNHFAMLIVLAAMDGGSGIPDSPHFYVDRYTTGRYRTYMEESGISVHALIRFLTDSTAGLPWPDEARRHAAALIADFVVMDEIY
ncbi:SAP domain-containing protein [Lacicoccus alkaliphilus]|uniref:SAP domain-containing protein n=1 Tax=Lacicoccus alkaliphilus TaxID=148453 RepID=UPI0015C04ACF|nr:SAP domain-containing protein [Salinicoccus alkaliphilus]